MTTNEKYVYTDKDGNTLFTKERYVKPDGSKGYAYSHVVNGETVKTMPKFASGTPLYNLHRLAKYDTRPVYLVEGEKCVDALTKLKLLATTSGGAQSDDKADWPSIAGREVIAWADNDKAGKGYIARAIQKLTALNASVKHVDVDVLNLPAKGDVVDWLARFEAEHGRPATKADIEALSLKDYIIQSPANDVNHVATALPAAQAHHSTVSLICAADIKPEAIRWLWNGWLAKGKLHIFAGMAGTGKTTISIALIAIITTGGKFPDGSYCPVGSVLIWSGEDSPADTLIPRLMAAGADLNRVHFIDNVLTADNEIRSFDPAVDMHTLESKAATIPDLALLMIDPIVNAVAGDSHKNGEVRRALQPVVDFGARLSCAVLGITHFSKGGQGKDPLERVTGSLAFGALARIVFATAKINDGNNARRIFCRAKSNISLDSGGFEYYVQQKEVQTGIFTSYALWGEGIEGSAKELLAESDETGESGGCVEWLDDYLKAGSVSAKLIFSEASKNGFSRDQVNRAKAKLKIKPHKQGFNHGWFWDLPSTNTTEDGDKCHEGSEDGAQIYPLSSVSSAQSSERFHAVNYDIARF